jgi:hypothetical protein
MFCQKANSFILSGILLFLIFVSLFASEESTATVWGKITDAENKKPIKSVMVKVKETDLSCETDNKGIYRIKNIIPGEYWIYAYKEGYWEKEILITLKANQIRALDFCLVKKE